MYLSLSPNSFLYWRHARLCENRILRIRLGDFHLHGKLAFSILFEYSIKISNVRLMGNDQLLPRMSYRFVRGFEVYRTYQLSCKWCHSKRQHSRRSTHPLWCFYNRCCNISAASLGSPPTVPLQHPPIDQRPGRSDRNV